MKKTDGSKTVSADVLKGTVLPTPAAAIPAPAQPEVPPHQKVAKADLVDRVVDDSAEDQPADAAGNENTDFDPNAASVDTAEPMVLAQAAPAASTAGTAGGAAAGTAAAEGTVAVEAAAAGAGAVSAGTVGLLGVGLAAAAAAAGGGGGGDSGGGLFRLVGRVVDGYVSGARIIVDANKNGVEDEGEDTGEVTDENGNFDVSVAANGPILAIGGTNIDTGLPNEIILKAPQGSTVINPLTTVLQTYIENNPTADAAAAQTAIKASLGIPAGLNITTYDPLAAAPGDATALAVQKIATQIVAAVVLSNGNGDMVFDNLSATSGAGTPVDLTNVTDLNQIYTGVAGVNVNAVVAANTAIDQATTLDPNAGSGSLTDLATGALDHANTAPVFVSAATANVAENSVNGTVVFTAQAADTEGDNLTYSLTDNAGGKFAINGATGQVTVAGATDFETAQSHQITVQVSDGTLTSTQVVTIGVTNVNEAPSITSGTTANFAENATGTVYQATGTDPEGTSPLIWSLTGADASKFSISASGAVTFNTSPNFEAPTDAGADNVYNIVVNASDGTNTTTKAVAVTVTNVNEAPSITSGTSGTIDENATGVVYTATGTDPEGATLTWSLTGADAALFSINASGEVTFNDVPDHEIPGDAGGDNVYNITVNGSDGTNTTTKAVAITVNNLNDNSPAFTSSPAAIVAEHGPSGELILTAVADDADGDTVTLSLVPDFGDAAKFTFNAATGELTLNDPADYAHQSSYTLQVVASDGTNETTQEIVVTVTTGVTAPFNLTFDGSGMATVDLTGANVTGFQYSTDGGSSFTSGDGTTFQFADTTDLTTIPNSLVAIENTDTGPRDAASGISLLTVTAATSHLGTVASINLDSSNPDYDAGLGDVTVTASSNDAMAVLGVNQSTAAPVEMIDSVIQLSASALSSDAIFSVSNAIGTISSVEATASGTSSDANVGIQGAGVVVTDLTSAASGSDSQSELYVDGGVTFDGSSITVSASGTDSSADLEISNVSGDILSLNIEASGNGSTASAEVHGLNGTIHSISVGTSAAATLAVASADVDLSGTIFSVSVEAAGQSSDAIARIGSEGTLSIVSGDISVSASGAHGRADFEMDPVAGSVASLQVTANGNASMASAELSISGDVAAISVIAGGNDSHASADVAVNGTAGDLTVQATGTSGDAALHLSGNVALTDSDILIAADGYHSQAELDLSGATLSGSIASITARASGQSTEAILDLTFGGSVGDISAISAGQSTEAEVYVGEAATVTMASGDITSTASGVHSFSEVAVHHAVGSINSINATASGKSSEASVDISLHGDLGDVIATASGKSSDVRIRISGDYSFGSTSADAADVIAIASGDSSDVRVRLLDVNGPMDHLTVQASGAYSRATVTLGEGSGLFGFVSGDILVAGDGDFSDANLEADGPVVPVGTIDSFTLRAGGMDAELNVGLSFSGTVNNINIEASGASSEADATLLLGGSAHDITITASAFSSEASLTLGEGPFGSFNLDGSHISVNATDTSAEASLQLNSISGTISSLGVHASGYSAEAGVTLNSGDLTFVDADISVTASGSSSDAFLHGEGAHSVTFSGGCNDINVTADGGGAHADLAFSHVSGDIMSLSVGVSGDASNGSLDISAHVGIGHLDGNIGSLNVVAHGNASGNSDEGTGSITATANIEMTGDIGSINVTAAGDSTTSSTEVRAELDLSISGDIGSINIDASGASAEAFANIDGHVTLDNSAISVTASGFSAEASLAFGEGTDLSGTISSINVEASGGSAEVRLNISGDLTMNDAVISVTSSGFSSEANLNLDAAGGRIASMDVRASGTSSDATVHASMFGSVGDINVEASGASAEAFVQVTAASSGVFLLPPDLVMDDSVINVTASGFSSEAHLDLGVIEHGPATGVGGTITALNIRASGTSSEARANVVMHGNVISGDVEASGQSSEASLNLTISGDVGTLTVSASGGSSEASADVTIDGTLGSVSVEASGGSSEASADISLNGTLGSVNVTASGFSSEASADISGNVTMDDSIVNVTASGRSSEADLDLTAHGGSIQSLNVTAAAQSAEADASIFLSGGGSISEINVSATSADALASVDVHMDGHVGGIQVLASSEDANANLAIDRIDFGEGVFGAVTMASGDILVQASARSSEATLDLHNASGHIGSLTVTTTGDATDASVDANVSIAGDLGSLTVTATGDSSNAFPAQWDPKLGIHVT